MKRQDVHIQKALMAGKVITPDLQRCKLMGEIANGLPLMYMGDRDLSTDHILNYMPEKGDPISLIGETTYDQYIFMLQMPSYENGGMDLEYTPENIREAYRNGDVDIWAYVDHNPVANFRLDQQGVVVDLLSKDPANLDLHPPAHVALATALNDRRGVIEHGIDPVVFDDTIDLFKKEMGGLENLRMTLITLIVQASDGNSLGTSGHTTLEWSGSVTETATQTDRFVVETTSIVEAFYAEKFPETHELLLQELKDTAITVVRSISCMNNYLKYGEGHMVEVVPTTPKKKRNTQLTKKRPWLNATGPHVLLLDRMPTTQKAHQGGTHASPKPHRRRGHWKTLQHPKYRHHPQYQKKIYIKPTFVGPKQVTYDGHIYRLVEPLEDIVG